MVLHGALSGRDQVEDGIGGDGRPSIVVIVEVRVNVCVRLEADRHARRKANAHVPGLAAEEVRGGEPPILRTQTYAGGRVLDAGPEVGWVLVLPQVVPHREMVRARCGFELELRNVHRLAVGCYHVLAPFTVGRRLDHERLHAHLEAACWLAEVELRRRW